MMSTFHLLDANGHPVEVNVDEVLAIRPTSNGPEFHTKHGVFYYPTTLEEFQALLGEAGFERLDRGNLVNMTHAKSFDKKSRKVYFEDPWTSGSFFATVSEANTHKVMHLVKEESSSYQKAPKGLFWSRNRT
ncbi:LytTR family transcriptional regulator DNA-binding domain-containing protein [Cohnella thailandensis]|uniref:LytTR family transcriptional regulator DNA-binding domain-containing protein n=2 Tax=Cohnella thailandensis TaxID=557557 RepID=A0A841SVX1_9BACL|nr:LytTR family transcriptional regulator DNA-binding domain-containing protein [Cohnella thailandensis]